MVEAGRSSFLSVSLCSVKWEERPPAEGGREEVLVVPAERSHGPGETGSERDSRAGQH